MAAVSPAAVYATAKFIASCHDRSNSCSCRLRRVALRGQRLLYRRRRSAQRHLHPGRRSRLGRSGLLRPPADQDAEPRPAGPRGNAVHAVLRVRLGLLAEPLRVLHRAVSGAAQDSRALCHARAERGPRHEPVSRSGRAERRGAARSRPATRRRTSASGTWAATRAGRRPTSTASTSSARAKRAARTARRTIRTSGPNRPSCSSTRR